MRLAQQWQAAKSSELITERYGAKAQDPGIQTPVSQTITPGVAMYVYSPSVKQNFPELSVSFISRKTEEY